MGLQNETVVLNFGNQNLFQNENCLPGRKKTKTTTSENHKQSEKVLITHSANKRLISPTT